MKLLLATIFTLSNNVGFIYSCAATSDSGVTTSTVATTTSSSCTSCDPAIVTFTTDAASPIPTHAPVKTAGPPQTGTGCSTLILTCTPLPDANPQQSLLNLYAPDGTDLGQAGDTGFGNPATGTLFCRSDGQWAFAVDTNIIGMARCYG